MPQQETTLPQRRLEPYLDSGLLGFEPGILDNRLHQRQQVVVALLKPVALLGTGEGQQLPYHPVHPLRLEPDPRQGVARLLRALLRQADGHLDAGQGGSQLVGDVVKQLLAPLDQLLQPLHHEIELLRHLRQLVPAPAQSGPESDPQIPSGYPIEAAPQGVHGPGQVPGEQNAEQESPQAANPEHGRGNVEPGEGAGSRPAGEDARVRSGLQQIGLPVAGNHGACQHAARARFPGGCQPGCPGRWPGRRIGDIEECYLQQRRRHGLAQCRRSLDSPLCQHGCRHLQMLARQLLGQVLFRGSTLGTKTEPEQLADQHDGQPEPQQNLPEQTSLEDHRILYPMLRTVSMVTASPAFCCSFCLRLQMCTSTLRS